VSSPRAYSDPDLEVMLADLESDLVERKESLARRREPPVRGRC
jgi:hypothetical protein